MPKYYLLDENKNKIEVENIEENLFRTILAKIHSELNDTDHSIEFVTQAQYNQLEAQGQLVANTYYFITDDTTAEDLEQAVATNAQNIEDIINGDTPAGKATNADNAQNTDFTNAQTKFYAYGYHQDGWYATIPASENGGEGYYWLEFADDRNNAYNLGIVHRFGGVYENVNTPLFLAIEDNDYLTQCFLYMKEQNDGSVKIQVLTQSSSTSTREVEIDNSTISIKKIR